jgi:hypothetical protein
MLLGVAALFWAVARAGDNETATLGNDSARADGSTAARDEPRSPVQEYLQFATAAEDEPTGGDEMYIADGLRKLAGTFGTLNLGDLDLQISLRVAAEHVLLDPASKATTDVVRSALISAADAIDERHQADSGELRRTAESIRPDEPLVAQLGTVRRFFRESADAIEAVSRSV